MRFVGFVLTLVFVGACGRHEPHYAPAARTPAQVAMATAGVQFSQAFVCPTERVAVQVEPIDTTPPASFAGDPQRVALYNQMLAVEIQRTVLVGASGCGQRAIYQCMLLGDATGCVLQQRGRLGLEVFAPTRTISRIEPGGLGERLGFQVGDVFVALDHQPVTDWMLAIQVLNSAASPGHVLTVSRAGSQVDIAVPNLSTQ
jgi:membrane-associated protease RseP (regulator of RpoE activity)